MMSFAPSTYFLLWLAVTWTAQGQLEPAEQEDNLQRNVTVQSVEVIVPREGFSNYKFQFKLSTGEEISQSGKLREVQGKKTVVLNGYVTEIVGGKTYRLRYASDENGKDIVVASREEVTDMGRYLVPLLIRKPTEKSGPSVAAAAGYTYSAIGPMPVSLPGPQFRRPPQSASNGQPEPQVYTPSEPQSYTPPGPQPDIVLEDPSGSIVLKLRNPTPDDPTLGGGVRTDVPSPEELLNTLGELSNTLASLTRHAFPTYPSYTAQKPEQVESQPLVCTTYSAGCIRNMDQVLEELTKNYDKKIRPNIDMSPTQVWADLHIRGVLGINEVDMDFKLSVELTLDWTDERLKVNDLSHSPNVVIPTRVAMDADQAAKIWIPQVTLLNEKDSVDSTEIFDKGSLVWNPHEGAFFLTKYGILTLTCEMSLQNFPMDTQICGIMVGSNLFGDHEIDLVGDLALDPIFSNAVKNMELAGYGVHRIVKKSTGSRPVNHTILVCDLLLKRHVGYYLIGTYFPAALVVIISWLTFWMPREGSAERMALGVTCVLTITTLLISAQSSSPKVSYVKALDIYMGVCFGLVFTTLLQSSLIGHWLRKGIISDGTRRKFRGSADGPESSAELATAVKRVMAGGIQMNYEAKILKQSKLSDTTARVLFPLLFVVFNVAYWTSYGMIRDGFDALEWKVPTTSEIPIIAGGWFGKENDATSI